MREPIRIDAHQHVWDLSVRDQPWTAGFPALRRSFLFGELRPELLTHKVDGTVLVQTIDVAEEIPELLALAATEPMISGVVGWVDLTADAVDECLAALGASPGGTRLVGLRHQVQREPDPRWLCRPEVLRGLAAVSTADLAFDLLITPAQLGAAVSVARALPQLRLVLDHAAKPPIASGAIEPWRAGVRELAKHDNVTVKLSGLATEADHVTWTVDDLRPYSEVVLDAFGPDRVMFGSDWPVCLLAATYDDVVHAAGRLTAELSESERAAVFGGTAVRTYRLGL